MQTQNPVIYCEYFSKRLVLCCEEAIVKHACEVIHCGTFQHIVEQQYRLNDIAMKEKLSFTADWR